MRQFISVLIFAIALTPALANAARGPIPKVDPVDYEGVRYTEHSEGERQCVQASDIKTGKVLWDVTVFQYVINPALEECVQWVFIKQMFIADGRLVVVAEDGRAYRVDLQSHAVKKLWHIPKQSQPNKSEVDALVLQLVSPRPAPHPSGYTGMTAEEDMSVPYMTAGVSNAISELKRMGTGIFPALATHLRDDRYSFSDISACWANLTVGDAVLDILADGHYMVPGYKFRKTPSGSVPYLSFKDYLREREPTKWAAWARSRSRLDIQLDFIDWCVAKEKERGFTDEAQRKGVLARYAEAREEAEKEHSEAH